MNNIFKKWFWLGATISILNGAAGLLMGLALMTESDKRKQGIAVIIWAILFFLSVPYINQWLNQHNAVLIPVPITSLPWILKLP